MDILYGHFEVHADYDLSPGNPDAGWRLSVSYNLNDNFNDRTQIVRLDPETTTFVASPRTGMTSGGAPLTITSAVSRLGPVGSPLWLFPQNNILGTPFLGARAVMAPGIFQVFFNGNYTPSASGSISLRLVSMSGSGPAAGGRFALWESDGQTLLFYLDTSNGIDGTDRIPTLAPNSHSHFNWGFTKPGIYLLTIEALGRLNPQHGGQLTSTQKTFRFSVPHSSRLTGSAVLRLGYHAASRDLHLLLEDATANVAYHPAQGFLEAEAAANSGAIAQIPGATRQMALTLSPAPCLSTDIVGLDPARAVLGAGGIDPGTLKLRLRSVSGPGHFALLSADASTVLLNSADGISAADEVALGSTDQPTLAVFTADGLYRVEVELAALAGGVEVVSRPMTLAFGAGLTAAYSYTSWRDSFERTHGLTSGTLSNTRGDHDQDGLSNGAEFQLFWHGCDPVKPDARLLPLPRPEAGASVLDYLRDTYKDTLNEGTFQQSPSTQATLAGTWATFNSRNPGRPLETCETGAEAGNAHGRIMARRLRVLVPDESRRFFRFVFKPD
jgi:surface-anchored protein